VGVGCGREPSSPCNPIQKQPLPSTCTKGRILAIGEGRSRKRVKLQATNIKTIDVPNREITLRWCLTTKNTEGAKRKVSTCRSPADVANLVRDKQLPKIRGTPSRSKERAEDVQGDAKDRTNRQIPIPKPKASSQKKKTSREERNKCAKGEAGDQGWGWSKGYISQMEKNR